MGDGGWGMGDVGCGMWDVGMWGCGGCAQPVTHIPRPCLNLPLPARSHASRIPLTADGDSALSGCCLRALFPGGWRLSGNARTFRSSEPTDSTAVIFSRSLLPLGCGLLVAASFASAQVLPPPPSFTPPPAPTGTPPTLPATLPGVPSNPGASGSEDSVRLTFSNSPVGDVLNFYAQLTGKRVLTDNTVNTTSTVTCPA